MEERGSDRHPVRRVRAEGTNEAPGAAAAAAGNSNEASPVATAKADEAVAAALFALAHPARLAILRQLRRARGLSEIEVMRSDPEGRRTALSRQAVKEHVGRLVEVGLLGTVEGEEDRRRRVRYVLNQQRVYALAERMREFSRLTGLAGADQPTLTTQHAHNAFDLTPRSLVMVKGPDEGRIFPLDAPPEGGREWVIGRQRSAAVALGHDAYVSGQNSVVQWDGTAYFVADTGNSRNGTRLNFQPLEPGRRERLRNGDLISVGHTILMFRA